LDVVILIKNYYRLKVKDRLRDLKALNTDKYKEKYEQIYSIYVSIFDRIY